MLEDAFPEEADELDADTDRQRCCMTIASSLCTEHRLEFRATDPADDYQTRVHRRCLLHAYAPQTPNLTSELAETRTLHRNAI